MSLELPVVVWANVEVFKEGRGKLPWRQGEESPRVIYDDNHSIVGMMDTADIAERVVAAVNRGVPEQPR